ncbi:DUF2073 domain-containing protein [Candidatus Woesearchaeota archaeon]|nr:DUF2073 domain-containing protein [Candidatus Woesearchaeota archaeon]
MLTLQIVPYSEIDGLSSLGRIRKLLNMAKENKVVLLHGRLRKEEEAELIKVTMEEINKEFRGIELAVMNPMENSGALTGFEKVKSTVVNALLGDRQGLTLVGPANIVKKVKKDPKKLQFMIEESKKKVIRKRKRK